MACSAIAAILSAPIARNASGAKGAWVARAVEVVLVEAAVVDLGLEPPNGDEHATAQGEALEVLTVERRQGFGARGFYRRISHERLLDDLANGFVK